MEKMKGFKGFLCSTLGRICMIILFYIIIFGIFVLVTNLVNNDYVIYILIVLFGIFGWKALNRITPQMFLYMSIFGWILYFLLKFLLSVLIGVFVTPFVISRFISNVVVGATIASIEADENKNE